MLVVVSLLPVLLYIKFPKVRLITRISPPSSYNQDTGQNNQFTITGQIKNNYSENIFLNISQANLYKIGPLSFTAFRFIKTISTENGQFSVSNLDAGEYLIAPKSLPLQKVYFSKKYRLTLADHNPQPILIDPPTASLYKFAIDSLSNKKYY